MTLEQALRLTNRNMIAFDLALGSGALLAPAATLRLLGHEHPSPDAEHLFRRCAPIWLTFAAAHASTHSPTVPLSARTADSASPRSASARRAARCDGYVPSWRGRSAAARNGAW